jgi:hypothetical protein
VEVAERVRAQLTAASKWPMFVFTEQAAAWRQYAELAERDRDVRHEQRVDATRQRHPSLTAMDRFAGQIHGHQRRRAGSVGGYARAAQIEAVGYAVGGDAV